MAASTFSERFSPHSPTKMEEKEVRLLYEDYGVPHDVDIVIPSRRESPEKVRSGY